jgi:hypothetical protein
MEWPATEDGIEPNLLVTDSIRREEELPNSSLAMKEHNV